MDTKPLMSTRVRLIIALVVVFAILGVLIGTAISKASTYYLTVSQLVAKGSAAVGAPETVSGVINKGSIQYDTAHGLLRFTIKDDGSTSVDRVLVSFHGPEPDDFNYGWPVIATGTLAANGSFDASKLLVKCPSKYQAQPKTYTASS